MLKQSPQHGFTLMEVCVAMLLASLFLTAMLAKQPNWLKSSHQASHRLDDFFSQFDVSTPNLTKTCATSLLASGSTVIHCKVKVPKIIKSTEYSILTE